MPNAQSRYQAHMQCLASTPLKIGALDLRVRLKEQCHLKMHGEVDVSHGEISVQADLPPKQRVLVAWAGIFEAIAYSHSQHLCKLEENQAHSAAAGLMLLLESNPHLTNAFLELADQSEEKSVATEPGLSLKIGRATYVVKTMTTLAGTFQGVLGMCHSERKNKKIVIQERLPARVGMLILLHELFHAFHAEGGVSDNRRDSFEYFDAQAQGLVAFARTNSPVLKWICESSAKRTLPGTFEQLRLSCPGWNFKHVHESAKLVGLRKVVG